MNWKPFSLAFALCLSASGCANYLAPFEVDRARPAAPTPATQALHDLPAPREPAVVAVYRFRDQTGQYKALENVSTFSTQVTQGATSILIQALTESGWFVPIEREGLSNLLNERQIIQSIRAQHAGPDGQPLGPLPPLLYAGVLLEGGIIGYDSNVLTGGLGARYFGAGASGEFRQDQVTIYLRAVSTQNGRVLTTVNTTKTIVSQQVQGSLFRFVDLDRLLEAETGYSYNEPPVLAVTEAIEEAVRMLVFEGIKKGLWSPAEAGPGLNEALRAYEAERTVAERYDAFGRSAAYDRSGYSASLGFGAGRLESELQHAQVRPTGSLKVQYGLTPHLHAGLSTSAGKIAIDGVLDRLFFTAEAYGAYYFTPDARLSPYVAGGGGVFSIPDAPSDEDLSPYLSAEAGFNYLLSPKVGVGFAVGNAYPLNDGLDGRNGGEFNDNVWFLQTRLMYFGL